MHRKLHFFTICLKNNNLSRFNSLPGFAKDDFEVDCSCFVEDNEVLLCEFENRFKGFDRLKPNFHLYNNSMSANVKKQLREF